MAKNKIATICGEKNIDFSPFIVPRQGSRVHKVSIGQLTLYAHVGAAWEKMTEFIIAQTIFIFETELPPNI